jgi:uncharacterized 2Fe-2S/4Fe-4S cluster protein (DUF4445 family)
MCRPARLCWMPPTLLAWRSSHLWSRQTCGKCLISLERGTFPKHGITSADEHLSPPDEAELAYAAQHGINLEERRFACSARHPGGCSDHRPRGESGPQASGRKAASDLTIEVAPAVRLAYVEVEPAHSKVLATGSDYVPRWLSSGGYMT